MEGRVAPGGSRRLKDSQIPIQPKVGPGIGAKQEGVIPARNPDGHYFPSQPLPLRAPMKSAKSGPRDASVQIGTPTLQPRTYGAPGQPQRMHTPIAPSKQPPRAMGVPRAPPVNGQPTCPCCAHVNELTCQLAGKGVYDNCVSLYGKQMAPHATGTGACAPGAGAYAHPWNSGTDSGEFQLAPSTQPASLYSEKSYLPQGGLVDFDQVYNYLKVRA